MKYVECDRCRRRVAKYDDIFAKIKISKAKSYEFDLCPDCENKFYRVFMALGGKKNEPVSDHQA